MIHTVYFPQPDTDTFQRLLNVFQASHAEVMPDVPLTVHTIEQSPRKFGLNYGLESNTHKLAEWARIVAEADSDIVLTDCDLMFVDRIDDAWQYDFDIGYTVRRGPFPFNGGVVFVRNTPEAKAIVAEWLRVNDAMALSRSVHGPWRARYGGINQAAFGYLLERQHMPGKFAALPSIYNACDSEWDTLKNPRVYHIKTRLRGVCLENLPCKRLQGIADNFRRLESSWSMKSS